MNLDVRWRQRFQNFKRAFILLREALDEGDAEQFPSIVQEGIIQRFMYTFELGWKVFKDYLVFRGANLIETTPRKVIKECAAFGLFNEAEIDGSVYLDMLETRNLLSHTYDFERFKVAIKQIQHSYLAELDKQHMYFLEKDLLKDDEF